ncbi:hypothetical protein AgCh_012647 [Apium graveolens]
MEGLDEMGLIGGTQVAIKRLTSGRQQWVKEFLVEVEMLSRLHHRNLVNLVGYYSSRDSSQICCAMNWFVMDVWKNGSMAAELKIEAYPLLDELTSKISTINLERVRDEIEQLMDDDGDMAEIYLTESVNGSRWLTNFPFLQSQLKEYIDDTEDFINIQLILYGAQELEQSKHEMNDIYDDALAIHHIVYNYANSLQDAGKYACFLQTKNMKQIQEALATPIGATTDFDEDELEAELEELESAELEEEILHPIGIGSMGKLMLWLVD